MRLLVIEDNRSLVANLFEYFEARGHTLDAAPDGITGLHLASTQAYDVVVLDWMLPRMDGREVLQRLRANANAATPVIMLTARDELPDKLAGFRAGADDYLTKPFALPELEVRIDALIARVAGRGRSRLLEVEDLRLDLATLEATRAGKPLHLYPACRKLLETLMQASPSAVSRDRLEHALWGDDPPDGDMLRSHVYELRRSVDGPFPIKLIHTLPRIGYRLAAIDKSIPMRHNTGLKRRILYWLMLYAVLLSAVVLAAGASIHEHVEHLAWKSLLRSELDYFRQRSETHADYLWNDTDSLRMFGAGGAPPVPAFIARRKPGLHDDVLIDGKQSAVLVDHVDGRQMALALDLTEFEGIENRITIAAVIVVVGAIVVLALLVMWGLGRVIEPLAAMARQVARLQPDQAGQRVTVDAKASTEMVVIADAFNDYLTRNANFVQREHAFIATSSHELRTPIAVMAGAAELALAHPEMPDVARNQVLRIHRTARNVEQLISLLLVLVKDPSLLGAASERVALDQLLPGIIEDHRHLTRDKDLILVLEPMPSCEIVAPESIVQAAIGNLLRNAIENSDRGEIRVCLQPDATVVIEDPGHGMSPEEISELYARVARGGRDGGGIGLDLISRLCEHLGWRLAFSSLAGRGTRTTLHLGQG